MFFNPASFLPAATSAFSPLGGGQDTLQPPDALVSSAEATASTRIQFSTGNISTGGGMITPTNLGIIGIVAVIGVLILKIL